MQSPLSEPEPATVVSEHPLRITYHNGVLSFPARHVGHVTPKLGDHVMATYHAINGDHIVLGLIDEPCPSGDTPPTANDLPIYTQTMQALLAEEEILSGAPCGSSTGEQA